jgi:hypothetical protein
MSQSKYSKTRVNGEYLRLPLTFPLEYESVPYSALTSNSLISKEQFEGNQINIGANNLTLSSDRFLNFANNQLTFDSVKRFRVLGDGTLLSGDTMVYIESTTTPNHSILKINNSTNTLIDVKSNNIVDINSVVNLTNNNTFGSSLSNQHTFSGSVNFNGSVFLNNEQILSTDEAIIEFSISGDTDGVNDTFLITPTPSQSNVFQLFNDGYLISSIDYSMSGNVLTITTPPLSGSTLIGYGTIVTGKDRYKNISLTIENGNGVSSGVKGVINVPFNGQILGWSILSNSIGDAVIDIYRDSFDDFTYPGSSLNSITGGNKPTISSQVKNKSFDLTSWDTSINKYDVLTVNVDSVSGMTYINFNLYLKDIS